MRFLLAWQHVRPGLQLHGRDGLARVIEQLQGFELAAAGWEREVLPARVAGYEPAWLDELCLSGEVAWGRLAPPRERAPRGTTPVRARCRSPSLRREPRLAPRAARPHRRRRIVRRPRATCSARLARCRARRSWTTSAARVRRLRIEVEEALCELVSAGLVTGDGFAGLRSLLHSDKRRRRVADAGGRVATRPVGTGRWALLAGARTAAGRRGRSRPRRAST